MGYSCNDCFVLGGIRYKTCPVSGNCITFRRLFRAYVSIFDFQVDLDAVGIIDINGNFLRSRTGL